MHAGTQVLHAQYQIRCLGYSERAEDNSHRHGGLHVRTTWGRSRERHGLPLVTGGTTGRPRGQTGQGRSTNRWQRETHTHAQTAVFLPPSCAQVWPTSIPLLPRLPGGARSHRFPGPRGLNLFPRRLGCPRTLHPRESQVDRAMAGGASSGTADRASQPLSRWQACLCLGEETRSYPLHAHKAGIPGCRRK